MARTAAMVRPTTMTANGTGPMPTSPARVHTIAPGKTTNIGYAARGKARSIGGAGFAGNGFPRVGRGVTFLRVTEGRIFGCLERRQTLRPAAANVLTFVVGNCPRSRGRMGCRASGRLPSVDAHAPRI